MADVKTIRTAIIRALQATTGRTVMIAEQNTPAPDYPYVSLKITQYPTPVVGADYMQGEQRVYDEMVEFTMSITCLNDGIDGAYELAEKARTYFRIDAHEPLNTINAHIQEITALTDRTTVLDIDFEHRVGFDVTVQTSTKETRTVDTFDSAQIEGGL